MTTLQVSIMASINEDECVKQKHMDSVTCITAKEITTFGLSEENLKNAIEKIKGKKPNHAVSTQAISVAIFTKIFTGKKFKLNWRPKVQKRSPSPLKPLGL